MTAVPHPLPDQRQRATAARQQIDTGHHSSRKEVASHPVVIAVGFEQVRCRAMAEQVHEQSASWSQPAVDATQQFLVVSHVLEHLHGDDSVEPSVGFEIIHIGHDDCEIGQSEVTSPTLNEFVLRT